MQKWHNNKDNPQSPLEEAANVHQLNISPLTHLREFASRKMRTSFIGALSEFEEYFGKLWGSGKPDEELTDAEKDLQVYWQECRTRILNNGNRQSRDLDKELGKWL